MPKPSAVPTWATDAGATSDPGPTRKATGFVAGKKLPAKWLNWVLSQYAAWFMYLRDLHNEPEFLNKVYNWTGLHRFLGTAHAADLRWTSPPRRKILVNLFNGIDLENEFLAVGGTNWKFFITFLGDGSSISGYNVATTDKGRTFVVPLPVPGGCRVLSVSFSAHAGGANATYQVLMASGWFQDSGEGLPPPGPLGLAGRVSPMQIKTVAGEANLVATFDMTKDTYGNPMTLSGRSDVNYWLEVVSSNMSGVAINGGTVPKYDALYWVVVEVEEYGPARLI